MGTPGAHFTKCNACDFSFCSNHGVGGVEPPNRGFLEAVCMNCLHRYVLPTQSPWGAEQAEILELHTLELLFRSRADRRAGRSYPKLTGTGVRALFDRNWYATGVISDVSCPSCDTCQSMAVEFMDGAVCPACKTGLLASWPTLK
jgi:hypothetical protein